MNKRIVIEGRIKQKILRLFFLFLGSRKQNVVEDKPVSGAVGMQVEICWRVANAVCVIFGVVARVKCECSLTNIAVNVFYLIQPG